jgi:hypothetical protein
MIATVIEIEIATGTVIADTSAAATMTATTGAFMIGTAIADMTTTVDMCTVIAAGMAIAGGTGMAVSGTKLALIRKK